MTTQHPAHDDLDRAHLRLVDEINLDAASRQRTSRAVTSHEQRETSTMFEILAERCATGATIRLDLAGEHHATGVIESLGDGCIRLIRDPELTEWIVADAIDAVIDWSGRRTRQASVTTGRPLLEDLRNSVERGDRLTIRSRDGRLYAGHFVQAGADWIGLADRPGAATQVINVASITSIGWIHP